MDRKVPASMAINNLDSNLHDFDINWSEGFLIGNLAWSAHDDDDGNNTIKWRKSFQYHIYSD